MERKPSIWKWTVRLLIAGVVFFGVVAVFNITMVGSYIYKLDKRAEEYANQPPPDPACFASDVLRIEIGGQRFDIPREELKIARGQNIPNATDVNYPNGDDICQKTGAPPVVLSELMFEIYTSTFERKELDCGHGLIQVKLKGLAHFPLEKRKSIINNYNSLLSFNNHSWLFDEALQVKGEYYCKALDQSYGADFNKNLLKKSLIASITNRLNSYQVSVEEEK